MLDNTEDRSSTFEEGVNDSHFEENTDDQQINTSPPHNTSETDETIEETSSHESPRDYPAIESTDLIHSTSASEACDDDDDYDDDDYDDDEYFMSDDEDLNRILSHDLEHARLPGSRSMADHVKFFTDALSLALDSEDIDKSLVLQAQISGNLNNENQKIIEKKELLIEKLKNLQILYGKNFGETEESKLNRVDRMKNDITSIEQRIAKLKNGTKGKSSIPFIKGKQNLGVVQKFPIEYNQAKDKVLERQFDSINYDNDDDDDLVF